MPSPAPYQLNLIKRLIEDMRLLILLIRDYLKGRYRDVSPMAGVVFILSMAYLIIPTDLISDFIPFLGQMDDAAVFFTCLYLLEKDLFRFRDWKESNR